MLTIYCFKWHKVQLSFHERLLDFKRNIYSQFGRQGIKVYHRRIYFRVFIEFSCRGNYYANCHRFPLDEVFAATGASWLLLLFEIVTL